MLPIPDLATLRVAPWLDRTAIVLCEHFFHDGSPVEIAPRLMLRRLADRAAERGLSPKFAAELEFFLFKESEESLEQNGYRSAALKPMNLRLGAYSIFRGTTDEHVIRPLTSHMEAFGIPIEYWNPEGGAGQHEVNLLYCDLLEAADRAFLFKHAVKEIADSHDLWRRSWPRRCPGSVRAVTSTSRCGRRSQNLCWQADAPGHLSDLALQLHRRAGRHPAGDDPALRSDDQLVQAFPARRRRRHDGLVGLREPDLRRPGHKRERGGTRVENRVPGGDVNPYLAMAGCIAGGLYGLENEIKAPDPIEHNAYHDASIPASAHLARAGDRRVRGERGGRRVPGRRIRPFLRRDASLGARAVPARR